MERARQDLPGVMVTTKTAEQRIQELHAAGQDTAWYDRGASARLRAPLDTANACSWFSIYLLDGDYAWTKRRQPVRQVPPSGQARGYGRLLLLVLQAALGRVRRGCEPC